jgi:transcription elongation factor GreA
MVDKPVTLNQAIARYLEEHNVVDLSVQAELRRFERWLGKPINLSSLSPLHIERYGESYSPSDPLNAQKLEALRKFLTYARDKKWTASNLSTHLKVKKGTTKAGGATQKIKPELAVLTRQGYEDIVCELDKLKSQRPHVLEEIRRAAADKDFRENAPLHAAREQLGHIDGRITELAAIVKSANIIGEKPDDKGRIGMGDTVTLKDCQSGQDLKFTIVGPKEANPAHGKISHVSPIGKAILGKTAGQAAVVATPSGNREYRIAEIHK